MNMHRLFVSIAATLVLAACASLPVSPGTWQMRTPDGKSLEVQISQLRENEYYINAARHPVSGVYTLKNKEMRITKPDNPRMGGFVWRLNDDNTLTLVEETPVSISGQKLISSTLSKH